MAGKSENPPEELREAQKEHIKANLPKLIELTTLDPITVSTFTQRKILGPGDMSKFKSIPDALEKNMEFYGTIQKRLKFFEVLLEAMKDQDEVLEILNKFETPCHDGRWQESGKEVQDVVVGSGKYTSGKIVMALNGSQYFNDMFDKWTNIARELESSKVTNLQRRHLHEKLTETDVIQELLDEWIGKNGSQATLQKLIHAFEKNKLGGCVEVLKNM